MEGTEHFVSLYTTAVITEQYNVMVNSEELIGTTEYLRLQMRSRVKLCFFNRVRLFCDTHPFPWKGSYRVLTQKTNLCLKLSHLKHKNVT